ncbi:competence protein ComEA [Virgibacillus phasianinus]|uniref:Competence protein ComEA n=1 Tax=Virgibacillus phasianinus TaxID=2017483 RepID=A0A220U575_9BACI|nr:helix-hairpin-helix domain-containing protein [Virgibacillus phasianinus]ASK63132.1 competence protein ComEA [Virgibacillus phasianinus]
MINFAKKNLFFIMIGLAVVLFLFVFNGKPEQEKPIDVKPLAADDKNKSPVSAPNPETNHANAYVDVKGEVKNPGVYDMPTDARVQDVIRSAGGFTKQANQSVVNLAQKVQDEMIILVPKTGEESPEAGSVAPTPAKINLNYATQEEIEQLNGIGPSKAQAIIQYREENGLFHLIEDVLNVPGIGEKTLENMKENIQLP